MIRLRIALGPAGYGIYFMLAETIYQTGKPIDAEQLDILAYEFHCTLEQITAVVNDFGLFVLTDEGYLLAEQVATQSSAPEETDAPAAPQAEALSFDDEYEVVDDFGSPFSRMPVRQQIKRTMSRRETYEQMLQAVGGDKDRLKKVTNAIIAKGQSFPSLSILITAVYQYANRMP